MLRQTRVSWKGFSGSCCVGSLFPPYPSLSSVGCSPLAGSPPPLSVFLFAADSSSSSLALAHGGFGSGCCNSPLDHGLVVSLIHCMIWSLTCLLSVVLLSAERPTLLSTLLSPLDCLAAVRSNLGSGRRVNIHMVSHLLPFLTTQYGNGQEQKPTWPPKMTEITVCVANNCNPTIGGPFRICS